MTNSPTLNVGCDSGRCEQESNYKVVCLYGPALSGGYASLPFSHILSRIVNILEICKFPFWKEGITTRKCNKIIYEKRSGQKMRY